VPPSSPGAPHLFIDFDGTLSTVDIGYDLFLRFGQVEPWITDLIEGRIGIRDYWHGVAQAFVPPSCQELDDYLLSIPIDPGAHDLVAFARAASIPLMVVSDGIDYYVRRYLELNGLEDLPLRCNAGWLDKGDGGARLRVAFPDAVEGCACLTAACKRNIVLSNTPPNGRIIYIGDGISDHCPAEHADVIFARDRLAAYCNAQRLPHYPFRALNDVVRRLRAILSRARLRERHQAAMKRKRAWEGE